ncbi:MAG: hypothetical protein K2X03_12665 [Bryobacteraceae bacterium]|nr:hypothetical protein [Bryobacteraceae bacterium]
MVALLFVLGLAQTPPALRLEEATFRQFEDGPPFTQAYRAGEQVFLDLRIAGYGRTDDENPELKLKWTIRAVNAAGQPFEPAVDSRFQTGLASQDSDYRPRARFSVAIPSFALEGDYRVEVRVTDDVTQQTADGSYPFRVRGKQVAKDAPLGTGPVRFYRQEEETAPLARPVYRPGAQVWLRFEIEGFLLGQGYGFDVGYGVVVTGPDGKDFLRQDPAAAETKQPFYPQAYVPATFVIQLPPTAFTGEYRVAIRIRDALAKKEAVVPLTFRVE